MVMQLKEQTGPVRSALIFDNETVRDTNVRQPKAMLDLREADYWFFEIFNGCNQSVVLQLVASISNDPGAAGQVGTSVTVAAGARVPWLTNIYADFLSCSASYAVAPTAGALSVIGRARPRRS